MLRRQVLLTGAAALFMAACAQPNSASAPGENDAPLPDDFEIAAPAATVAPEIAAYSGLWVGRWGTSLDGKIAITKVADDGAIEAIYAWGGGAGRFTPGWSEHQGNIQDGKLALATFGNGAEVSYELTAAGVLKGRYVLNGEISRGTFTKEAAAK